MRGDPGIVSGMLTPPSSPLNVPAESRPGVGGGVGGGHFLPLLVCFSSDRNADSDLFSGLGARGDGGSSSISTGDCAFTFTFRSIGFGKKHKTGSKVKNMKHFQYFHNTFLQSIRKTQMEVLVCIDVYA